MHAADAVHTCRPISSGTRSTPFAVLSAISRPQPHARRAAASPTAPPTRIIQLALHACQDARHPVLQPLGGHQVLQLRLALGLLGMPAWYIHMCGLVLVVSRIVHAMGLSSSSGFSIGRLVGTLGTMLTYLAVAGALLVHAFTP